MRTLLLGLFGLGLFAIQTSSACGQYVRPRTIEPRRTLNSGSYRQEDDSYVWAVFRPEVIREEIWRRGANSGHISVWIARRSHPSTHMFNTHTYDLLSANGLARLGRAHRMRWNQNDPPPIVDWYWEGRESPDWFQGNGYQLFYPVGENGWWCRRSDGQWDLIEEGQLTQEKGKGPPIDDPVLNFAVPRAAAADNPTPAAPAE